MIDTDAYLKVCYQYIELNPVRANLSAKPEDYRWSSHRYHAFGEPDPVITLHHGYEALGKDAESRQQRYRGWFREQLSAAALSKIRGER
jgi:putative transposase